MQTSRLAAGSTQGSNDDCFKSLNLLQRKQSRQQLKMMILVTTSIFLLGAGMRPRNVRVFSKSCLQISRCLRERRQTTIDFPCPNVVEVAAATGNISQLFTQARITL